MPLEPLVIVAWALCAALFAAYAASVAGEITYVTLADGRKTERRLPIVFRLLLPFVPNLARVVSRPAFAKSREAAELFASLLDTKAVGRLTPEVLEWTARTMMDAQDWKAARAAASVLERRQVDPAWTQTAATLLGQAHERLGESDAAKEAYARALATGSETECGAQAALALGRLESAGGQFDEAREHLENAVTRAQSPDQLPLRIQAYAALAANEEERGEMDKALGYHMLVGSLFNEERQVAHALSRAAAILREKGREKEAADVMADLRKRFPNAPEAQ